MHQFGFALKKGLDVTTGLPVLGFDFHGNFVHNPNRSSCERFEVSPVEHYGLLKEDAVELARLNKTIADATEAALNAGCLVMQDALGVETGDVAGVYFSGPDETYPLAAMMTDYLLHEMRLARID